MWQTQSALGRPGITVRFVLIDTTGPLAEFDTWEEASRFLRENPGQGSIVSSERMTNPWPVGKSPEAIDPGGATPAGPVRPGFVNEWTSKGPMEE